jgi:tetratricopeptide (TPR) repeat protein
VLDFQGRGGYGRFLSDLLIEQLLKEDRGIQNVRAGLFGGETEGRTFLEGATSRVFEIVERSALEHVLREQKFGTTGLVKSDQAAAIGKILGVDAIIVGDYSIDSKEKPSREEWYYKKDGKEYTEWVSCLTRTTTVTVSARVVRTNSAEILATYSNPITEEIKGCDDEVSEMSTTEVQIRSCATKHADVIADMIAPRFTALEIELEKVKTKEFKKVGEEAAKLAEQNSFDEAYLLYYSLYEDDPYNPKILFNLAALHEVVGNYDEALEMYNTAIQLKSEKRYREGKERVERCLNLTEFLRDAGIEIVEHNFELSDEALADTKAAEIKVKGKREERFDIMEKPSPNSAVITKIPGDIKLKVISYENGWYLVELPGGKQGYINEERVEKL